jgi:EmrB/QacA subfamily drug resistance transporter
MGATARIEPSASSGSRSGIGTVSIAASAAAGVVILNQIIVNVAFVALGRHLHAPVTTVQWVATGYVLGLMAAVGLTSWAAGRFGYRRLLIATLTGLLIATALCTAAWSIGSLILFRVLAGLSGGMILPLAQALVVRAAGGLRLGTAMSILNAPVLAAPVLGPVLGGALVALFGWRGVFAISIPLVLLALALAFRGIPRDRPEGGIKLDCVGLALLSTGLGIAILGFSSFSADGTYATGIAAVGSGAVLVAGFVVNANRLGGRALLNVSLFRHRSLALPALISAGFGFMLFSAAAVVPLYFETARGASTVTAGLFVAAQGIGSVLGVLSSGRLVDRVGPWIVAVASITLALAGTLPFVLLTPDTPATLLVAALVVRGAGLSGLMNAAYAVAYGELHSGAVPSATAGLNIISRVSAAASVAVAVAIVQTGLPGGIATTTGLIGAAGPHASASAFSALFVVLTVIGVATAVPVLALPGPRRLRLHPRSV